MYYGSLKPAAVEIDTKKREAAAVDEQRSFYFTVTTTKSAQILPDFRLTPQNQI